MAERAEEESEGLSGWAIGGIVAGGAALLAVGTAVVVSVFKGKGDEKPAPGQAAEGPITGAAESGAGTAVGEAASEAAKGAASEAAKGAKPSGPPPNISGDPEGYNSKMFPSPLPVRQSMSVLGYAVDWSPEVADEQAPGDKVAQFSRDYNRVSEALSAGKVTVPANAVSKPTGIIAKPLNVPGKTFLAALEVALLNQQNAGVDWQALVKKAKEAKLS